MCVKWVRRWEWRRWRRALVGCLRGLGMGSLLHRSLRSHHYHSSRPFLPRHSLRNPLRVHHHPKPHHRIHPTRGRPALPKHTLKKTPINASSNPKKKKKQPRKGGKQERQKLTNPPAKENPLNASHPCKPTSSPSSRPLLPSSSILLPTFRPQLPRFRLPLPLPGSESRNNY